MSRSTAVSLAVSVLVAGTLIGAHAVAAPAAACGSCGHNLIKNAGAEAGKGTNADTKVLVPHWKATGNFTAASYHWSGGDLSASTPRPHNHGKNYFYGGPEGRRHATGTQVITLARSGIKGGKVTYKLSGWLGGYSSQSDNAVLTATFERASGKSLAVAKIGPVTPGQRHDASALLHRSTSGKVPAGSAKVSLVLTLSRHDASDDDGLADTLSLVLTPGR